ncbi:MAG: hypothetical protein R2713_17925 [Ilumatobacteraceae bacterium]
MPAPLVEADWVRADLLTIDLVELLDGVDAVVHLAGRPGVQTSWGHGFDDHLAGNPADATPAGSSARHLALAGSWWRRAARVRRHPGRARCRGPPLRPLSPYGAWKLPSKHCCTPTSHVASTSRRCASSPPCSVARPTARHGTALG